MRIESRPTILRAVARNRVVVAYHASPERLEAHLPSGLAPDMREGRAYVMLVGLELVQVRVLGLPGPGFRRVPALELQVPVRDVASSAGRRGTITMKAFVPRRLVAWGARVLYGEPVHVAAMQPVRRDRGDRIEMTYRVDHSGREQRLRAVADKTSAPPAAETATAFLLDRNWRFGTGWEGGRIRARIQRPFPVVHRVREHFATVQWDDVYGRQWSFLQGRDPAVVLFSPGGPIRLRWRDRVE